MATFKTMYPCLWFDTQAEEAAQFYTGIFDGSRILEVTRYGSGGPRPEGLAMTVIFELAGQRFMGLNGGPDYKFNESISFVVNCDTQDEVDELWAALTAGGQEGPCGWLKDRFGLSWQIVPTAMQKLLTDPDPNRAQGAMRAMLGMKKLDVAALRAAADAAVGAA
ncbi:MAG TPA: VOC family protein [Acidimicrobiales bacterium]|jgi:predicted 3-demethylubiquinone-9 3-methyltransferase (glyoxalase superfamily)|nr:VOC family protein [Acidimicrobiales bacterium]